jgi:hypothetical protein
MKRIMILLIAVSLLTACAVVPGGRYGHPSGEVMVVAPILPSVVVLDIEPFYFYSDFHYHYAKKGWYYSKSRSGPWYKLPKNRYPKEVKYKGKGGKYYRNRDEYQRDWYRERDYKRDRDRDENYQR